MKLPRQRGFTLIEIMVVVMIIGLSVGMATLAISPDEDSVPEKAIDKFLRQTRFVNEQAVLTGEVIALFVEPRSTPEGEQWCYRWRRFRNQSWQRVTDFLNDNCFHRELSLEMVVEGEPYEYDPEESAPSPVLMFYPSGEASRFELALFKEFDSDEVQRVEVDMMGGIHWRNREREQARLEMNS